MTESQENRIIEEAFGNKDVIADCFNIRFTRAEATIDHKWPLSKKGSDNIKNIKVMSSRANREKGNNLEGWINNRHYIVEKAETLGNGKIVGRIKIVE